MKVNFDRTKCITAVVLLLAAILSVTVIGKYVSAPENHQKTIASLDEKKQTVMELTAAALNPAFGAAADLGTGWALLLGAAACGVGLVLFLHGMGRLN